MEAWEVPPAERRILRLAKADCVLAAGDTFQASQLLLDLLVASTDDLVARESSLRLQALPGTLTDSPKAPLLIGMAFHANREFERSTAYLERGLASLDPETLTLEVEELFGYRYASARGFFWLQRYREAALRFEELAEVAPRKDLRADCRYQAARSRELMGDWKLASATYRQAYLADRTGEWSGAALISALRIEFRGGYESEALDLFQVLRSRPAWQGLAHRAALFLSSSDLVRGRADRAAGWLRLPATPTTVAELLYWQGRTAEMQGSPYVAIRNYLEILRNRPHHPLASEAWLRLRGDALSPLLVPVGQQLAATGRRGDLHSAWLLLGDDSATGSALRERLWEMIAKDRRAGPYLRLERVAAAEWLIWNTPLNRSGERMLALGVWQWGAPYVLRHFPVSQPSLAFTGSSLLAEAGLTRRSMYIVEILNDRLPTWVPQSMLPETFRRLLYPYPYRQIIQQRSERVGIEPALLAALIREESRFDPEAVSAASARGLTQFVYSTALELAPAAGLRHLEPTDLNKPKVAIALGATYLSRLLRQFDGRIELAVTAYNAGEEQTRLWKSYCYSREPAEYFSKVGFPQTRGYLRKVLSSRNQYRELYGSGAETLAALQKPAR
jgi:soluble lytic murein transglycosylase